MTAQRQERYGWRHGIAFFALVAGLFAIFAADFAAHAQTTERVIVNRYSGLAIEGFDPVAYFTDQVAIQGLPDFEASEVRRGLALPQRGQPGLLCLPSRGLWPPVRGLRPGRYRAGGDLCRQPADLWLVVDQRLYLFGRPESRDAFAADPARFLKDATARWPALEQGLAQ